MREQGDAFTEAQTIAFELEPFAGESTRLRRYDDDGNVDGLDVAPLDHYRDLLTRRLAGTGPVGPESATTPARSTTT